MFTREDRQKNRENNAKVLKESLTDKDSIIAIETDRITKRYEKIEAEIRNLQDEKSLLMEGAITKEEVLKNAKIKLRAERERLVKELLGKHLKSCQERNLQPFVPVEVRTHMISEYDPWKLFYFAISESDLEEAVAGLDDIGMASTKRKAKIAEIDNQIASLSEAIKKDLDALKK